MTRPMNKSGLGRACGRMGFAAFAMLAALAVSAAEPQATGVPGRPHVMSWSELGKLPDFTTGIWEMRLGPGALTQRSSPSLTPAYAAMLKAYTAQDTPDANCLPPGMPVIMGQPYPMQILFGPREVTLDIEAYMQVRHIYTDGRPLPADPDPTFNGTSIGHWEGQTLVVDTVGFEPDTPLSANWGMHHSSKMRIVERFRLTDPNSLQVVTEVNDPVALTRPWTSTRVFERHRDWTIAEYICEQNNRNLVDQSGKAGIILTPPK